MEIGDGEAEAGGGLEASAGRVHSNCWRREGVVGWEDEGPPVLAIMVRSIWGSGEDVVPSAGGQ